MSGSSSAIVRFLREQARASPELAILELERRGITSLEPLLPILAQLKNMGELSLAGNSIAALPADLASLELLTVLDLTSNPLRDLGGVLSALATLPSLAVLRIDLASAADRRRVCRTLPYLQVLNGAPTGTDEADDEAALVLEGGRRDVGSGDRGSARATEREESVAPQPQRREEETAPPPQQQEQLSQQQGQQRQGGAAQYHGITKDALTNVARLYGAIEQLFQHGPAADDPAAYDEAQAEEDFDRHVTNTLDALASRKAQAGRNAHLAAAHVAAAHDGLYDVCEEKLLQYAEEAVDDGGRLRGVLQMLFDARAGVAADAAAARAQLAVQADRSERELEQVLQTAEMLEQQVDVETMKNKILSEAFDKERDRLIRRAAQAGSGSGLGSGSGSSAGSRPSHRNAIVAASSDPSMSMSLASGGGGGYEAGSSGNGGGGGGGGGAVEGRDMTLKQLLDVIEALYESKTEFDRKCEEARQPKETMQQHLITYLRKQYGLPSLLESHAVSIMRATKKYARRNNDVMVFKKIIDSEFEEEFRFVQSSLKKSVKSLLRAYLRDTHKRKSTAWVDSLLKRRTSKTGVIYEKEWTDILKYMYNVEDAMNLTCMLKEMADQQEAEEAANARQPARGQPRRLVQQKQQQQQADGNSKYAIRYLDFEQVLLNFQLKGHEKFLRQFCQVFREYDPDAKGLLDEKDFRLLVLKINPNKTHDELDHLVATVDPYNNQLITYSQVVNVLQDEIEILASGLHPNFPASDFN